METGKEEEKVARQLHKWYLEATKPLFEGNYNKKAQIPFHKLNEEQKEIDRYIARKLIKYYDILTPQP